MNLQIKQEKFKRKYSSTKSSAQNGTYVVDDREIKIIKKDFKEQADIIKPYVDFLLGCVQVRKSKQSVKLQKK